MQEPADELTTNGEPPSFDTLDEPSEVVTGETTFDRVYTTVLQLTEPATVTEIAERSDCSGDAARRYLRRFVDMGIIRRTDTEPERFVVDRAYLAWRRANRLRRRHSDSELVEQLQAATEEIETYRDRYGHESPDVVDVTDQTGLVEETWDDLSRWKTAVKRRETIERALEMSRSSVVDSQ